MPSLIMNFIKKVSKKMYPHTNDITKDITYVNVSHYCTVMKSQKKQKWAYFLSTILLRLIPRRLLFNITSPTLMHPTAP